MFKGIRYSTTTRIYYKWKASKLYRFCTTRTKGEYWGWEPSDYTDMSGNSSKWEPVPTEEVEHIIKTMNPNNKKKDNI